LIWIEQQAWRQFFLRHDEHDVALNDLRGFASAVREMGQKASCDAVLWPARDECRKRWTRPHACPANNRVRPYSLGA
jgi:hypothetical protein